MNETENYSGAFFIELKYFNYVLAFKSIIQSFSIFIRTLCIRTIYCLNINCAKQNWSKWCLTIRKWAENWSESAEKIVGKPAYRILDRQNVTPLNCLKMCQCLDVSAYFGMITFWNWTRRFWRLIWHLNDNYFRANILRHVYSVFGSYTVIRWIKAWSKTFDVDHWGTQNNHFS